MTDRGYKKKFLVIEINQLDENTFNISKPSLIDRIISFPIIDTDKYGMDTKSKSTPVGKSLLKNTFLERNANRNGTTEQQLAC